jgi:hypothetical protein
MLFSFAPPPKECFIVASNFYLHFLRQKSERVQTPVAVFFFIRHWHGGSNTYKVVAIFAVPQPVFLSLVTLEVLCDRLTKLVTHILPGTNSISSHKVNEEVVD